AVFLWPCAMVVAGAAAALVGALSLRTSGIYFIFITLAFGQMTFYVVQSFRQLGGDDGFALTAPTRIAFGVTSADPVALFYAVLGLTGASLFLAFRLTRSQFGQVIQGRATIRDA